jgi:hypothetical protein
LSRGSVVAPYAESISAPLLDSLGCSSADAPARDGIAARILSADNAASAAGALNASADPLDFADDLYHS